MEEVSGPIVAIALVLCAVFVPIAFVSGLTGQFYRQFALTIAISTVISAFNSLTLSPALAALLLKSHDAPKDTLSRWIDRLFGWLFRPFNRLFQSAAERYGRGLAGVLSRKAVAMGVYVILIARTAFLFRIVPGGYVPQQDKNYLIGIAQLPDAASLERTEACDPAHVGHRARAPGRQGLGRFPGPVDQRLLERAQRGHRVLRPEGLRRSQGRGHVGQRDRRRAQPEARRRSRMASSSCCRRHRSTAWGPAADSR